MAVIGQGDDARELQFERRRAHALGPRLERIQTAFGLLAGAVAKRAVRDQELAAENRDVAQPP